MPECKLYVELLAHTPAPEAIIAMSARLCYSGAEIDELAERANNADNTAFLHKLMDMGHHSPVEHASFTFGVQGVSRALLAQLTRHRIASFSVQSQRYVDQAAEGFHYILPPAIAALGEEAQRKYAQQMEQIQGWYGEWMALLAAGEKGREDARFVLPSAAETRLTMTMNARELLHFFRIRCCMRAQWEVRALAWAVLGHCLRAAPELFAAAGPGCVTACTEGRMSCGRAVQVKQKLAQLADFVEEQGAEQDFARRLSSWARENTYQV